jgi:serine/threonine-protein kinase
VDARTDIWSLGVVLYECLTGTSPFAATTVGATCARILHEDPPPPSELRSEVPPALDERVLRCFSKDPAGRYPTILELARALAPFGSEASSRSLSWLESHWANAEPGPGVDAAIDSDRGDLSTETAVEPVPSLAVIMHSTFRRLPRGFGVGGVIALTLVLAALAVAGAPWLRRGQGEGHSAARPVDASAVNLPSPPLPPPLPLPAVPSAPNARALGAPSRAEVAKPVQVARSRPGPRSRPESSSAPLPSAASTARAPAPAAAFPDPPDPEAIYTDRK